MKILVVEDDKIIAETLAKALMAEQYNVDIAFEANQAITLLRQSDYSLVIADIMLPGMNGLELIELIRKNKKTIPVLILSARQSIDDRVVGLQSGGDDYLVKPFALPELLARVQALLRRSNNSKEFSLIQVGDISVDLIKREATRGSIKLDLQAKEFSLLELFMRNEGNIVSKEMVLEKIWNYKFDPQTNVVDVLVCRLRNKLDRAGSKKMLKTIRGVGYLFQDV